MLRYPELFSPFSIGKCKIKNRVVMEPMRITGMADIDGQYSSQVIRFYEERAKGGTGLIITACIIPYVHNEESHLSSPFDDMYSYGLGAKKLTDRVHSHGAKIFEQLGFGAGRTIFPLLLKEGSRPVGPSEIPSRWNPELMCRELSVEEIHNLIEAIAQEALFCKKCGFDGIDVHSVYGGYLGDTFAMKIFNKRKDEYGGDLRGRLKLATDTVRRIKELCGKDFPVILRFGIKHYMKGLDQGALPGEKFVEVGRDVEESIEAAHILKEAGYDALNIANGSYDSWYWCHPPMYQKDGCWLDTIAELKKHVDMTIIGCGKINTPEMANDAIKNGVCDAIGLARALVADPFWARKARDGKPERIRPCIACHTGCMGRIFAGKPVACAVNPELGREQEYELTPALEKKSVAVIGAGVAGMEAARIAAKRGHSVDLYDRNGYLGGTLHAAAVPDFKDGDRRLIRWYERELNEAGVRIHLNTEIDAETATSLPHDEIILANGAKARELPIPGKERLVKATDVLLGTVPVGEKVVVVGGGQVGCELAVWLKEKGHTVEIVEFLPELMSGGAEELCVANRTMLRDMVAYNEIPVHLKSRIVAVDEEGARIVTGETEAVLPADTVIASVGYYADQTLYDTVAAQRSEVWTLGDQNKPSNILYAIADGAAVGRNI